ncbi:hypothetical protein QR680_004296 [Steinernema hermaphroditum]|uniref:Uncharacterized protein n=1 Tax=Steinernema hermaphroditum TaxID=289476 RepID=A0AA39HPA2_9BILA|nr:hypothetical protein QR680_004296 [Steinernema hermaphroditum]
MDRKIKRERDPDEPLLEFASPSKIQRFEYKETKSSVTPSPSKCQIRTESNDSTDEEPDMSYVEEINAGEFLKDYKNEIDCIVSEKLLLVNGKMRPYCQMRWQKTWEPKRHMVKQLPLAYTEFLEAEKAKVLSIADGQTGMGADVTRTLVFNVSIGGVVSKIGYEDVRRRFPDALIDFYLGCINIVREENPASAQ